MAEISNENVKLLMEIHNLKKRLSELDDYSGPNSSKYLTLSIQLKALEKEYLEEKLNYYKETFDEIQKQQEVFNLIGEKNQKHNKLHHKDRAKSWHFIVNR